jgi:hypothetical protein
MSETPEMGPASRSPGPDEKRRTGRGIKIALAVSLALNLLVAGLVGGAVLSRPDPGEAPAIRTLGLGPFALALPREARDDIRRRIEADMGELRRNRAEVGRSLWRCGRRSWPSPSTALRRRGRWAGPARRRWRFRRRGTAR